MASIGGMSVTLKNHHDLIFIGVSDFCVQQKHIRYKGEIVGQTHYRNWGYKTPTYKS